MTHAAVSSGPIFDGSMRKTQLSADYSRDTNLLNWAFGIREYKPHLPNTTPWLPVVERRIKASMVSKEFSSQASAEHLSENSANAAIEFFYNSADLLPSEPHIYATNSGDFVAEFDTPKCTLTTIVSSKETILFVVAKNHADHPLELKIPQGSNQKLRSELRSIKRRFSSGSYGKVEAAR